MFEHKLIAAALLILDFAAQRLVVTRDLYIPKSQIKKKILNYACNLRTF